MMTYFLVTGRMTYVSVTAGAIKYITWKNDPSKAKAKGPSQVQIERNIIC